MRGPVQLAKAGASPVRAELEQLAVETLGEPGRALVEAIENEFGD